MSTLLPKPLRIAAVELCDYRAFPGPEKQTVWLVNDKGRGMNLLLYGENGSGKSALGKALRDLLMLDTRAPGFDSFRHMFTDPPSTERGVRIMFDDASVPDLVWSPADRDRKHIHFAELARTRGWFDYRQILRASVVAYRSDYVDVFGPLVEELITECEMPGATSVTSPQFGSEWEGIRAEADQRPRKTYHERTALAKLEDRVRLFNTALAGYLPKLEEKANELLNRFVPWTEIRLTVKEPVIYNSRLRRQKFYRGVVALRMNFRGRQLPNPGDFLNESRLSAVGLALHLAGLSLGVRPKNPNGAPALRLLVLDDILISLDMTHRRPLLDLLEEFFGDWQVFLLTHDRAWYELAKQRLGSGRWIHVEMFACRVGDYEQPLLKPDVPHLPRARKFEGDGETKAAAVHVRTEFELILKRACQTLEIPVPFNPDPHGVTLKDLWDALSSQKQRYEVPKGLEGGVQGNPGHWSRITQRDVLLIPPALATRVSLALSWVLNPLSHSETIERYRDEVRDAVKAVEELGHRVEELCAIGKWRLKDTFRVREKLVKLLDWRSSKPHALDQTNP